MTFNYEQRKGNVHVRLTRLELDHLSLSLLVSSKFEMFASFNGNLLTSFAFSAFHSQHNLFGGLSLLVENGFGLTSVSALFPVVTAFSLSEQGSLTSFVLRDLVQGMLLAVLVRTVGLTSFWDVDHGDDTFYITR